MGSSSSLISPSSLSSIFLTFDSASIRSSSENVRPLSFLRAYARYAGPEGSILRMTGAESLPSALKFGLSALSPFHPSGMGKPAMVIVRGILCVYLLPGLA